MAPITESSGKHAKIYINNYFVSINTISGALRGAFISLLALRLISFAFLFVNVFLLHYMYMYNFFFRLLIELGRWPLFCTHHNEGCDYLISV